MELITIPQALIIFYGFVVLGCGSVLGFILGRNRRRQIKEPTPPEQLERRVRTLEHELESARSDLLRLQDESAFLRELRAPPPKERRDVRSGRAVA